MLLKQLSFYIILKGTDSVPKNKHNVVCEVDNLSLQTGFVTGIVLNTNYAVRKMFIKFKE